MARVQNLLTRCARRFVRDRSGNVAMMWGLMGAVLIGLLGLAVDFTRAQAIRAQLQNAVDGAVLAAARDPNLSESERNRIARGFFDAEIAQLGDVSGVEFSLSSLPSGGVRGEASVAMPVSLAAIIRDEDWRIGVSAEAEQSGVNLEVAMVLDTTGSMAGQRIADLRVAAADLVSIVVRDDQEPFYSKVALVPYSMAVNVGPYAEEIRGPVRAPTTITNATRASPVVVTSTAHGLANGDVVYIDGVAGMTELNSRTFTVSGVTANSFALQGVDGRSYRRYRGGGEAHCTEAGCDYFLFTNAGSPRQERVFQISSCVTERAGGNAYTDVSPRSSLLGRNYPSASNPCPADNVIVPLTDNADMITNRIEDLDASGSTAGHIGIAWGWYLLSPRFGYLWPSVSAPGSYGDEDTLKIAVIMTDGEYNSAYCNGVISRDSTSGSGSASDHINCDAPNGHSFTQAQRLCREMKDAGIIIYTVGFEIVDDQRARDLVNNCATDASHVYMADSGSELRSAFRAIATSITQLRISR